MWARSAAEPDVSKPVTVGEIDAVEFTVVNRRFGVPGYVEGEVDEFLDRCSHTIADLTRERDALAARLARAESKLVSL